MKTELKAKFLQHILNKKKNEEGFTLIELLVVIIIIGILSAIALPSFLNQANKAKQSEAKTYIGSMNRAQQAYFAENGAFVGSTAADFGQLGLGVSTGTANYKYAIKGGGATATSVTNQAQPQKTAIKAYIGGVSVGTITATSEATTLASLCEALLAKGVGTPATGTEEAKFTANAAPACDAKYKPIS
ncbi:type IV pilin-like G/H family protein [Calothrix sp. UHCC 0171]|uniref:type IV pilin-like G/H family protein n=1 Tax=Calothrix sp. UHCC 0171 TaxID=3110245 RepID=UPI002B1F1EC1|nr:type IV pilin-like G/H family protein [Calothrix sp. UHCC 0171]MEA5570529.1 type IV pilin-like G/H family protein [Calothrix sp. UHCC 0171]